MASFKAIDQARDISTATSTLNQLVDVVQEDISGSSSRRKYQIFVTGGIGPGVTSSLFQTVYDQDYSLQTANAVFDMTVGLFSGSQTVQGCQGKSVDASGKLMFNSSSMMMREKCEVYQQFAQMLLGDEDAQFYAPGVERSDANLSANASTGPSGDRIEEALFINFRRLFARDEMRRETFAIQLYNSGVFDGYDYSLGGLDASTGIGIYLTGTSGVLGDGAQYRGHKQTNIDKTSSGSSTIYADIGATQTQLKYFGGDVGYIRNTSNSSEYAGLIWYDQGIAVLDMGKVFFVEQHMSGTIGAMSTQGTMGGYVIPAGKTVFGYAPGSGDGTTPTIRSAMSASFIPQFMRSGSIDDIVDHIASTRFQSGSLTAATFQNITNINSTLYFCRARADEFNYSSNPTFRDDQGNVVVVDQASPNQRSFTFITSVGLYNSSNELMAVAKLSRPIEKNDEKDLTVRVRLDF